MSQVLVSVGFFISFSVLITLFLEFCFREGNIFEGWLRFWCKVELFFIQGLPNSMIKEMTYDELLDNTWYSKAFGACVVCFGFWVSALVLLRFTDDPIVYIYSILLSNFLVRLLYEKIL